MLFKKVAIDLGTANTLVYVPKKGVVLSEPSVVAIAKSDRKVMAVGNEAKDMLGRTPDSIIAQKPLKDGVIADYKATESMIRYFINKSLGGIRLFAPEVMIAVPAGITSTERRAVVDATLQAGAKSAYLIKQPLASAIGAGIPIGSASGHMIIEIGGGTSEIAVISLGGIVNNASVRVGGTKLDAAIQEYVRKHHNLGIGERTAEEMKITIGSALPLRRPLTMDVRGSDIVSGLPKTITLTSDDITKAIQEELREIVEAVKSVLQETPPELAADVIDKGMVLSGGGGMLRNLDELLSRATGVPSYVAEDSLQNVVKGTGVALENLESYKRSVVENK